MVVFYTLDNEFYYNLFKISVSSIRPYLRKEDCIKLFIPESANYKPTDVYSDIEIIYVNTLLNMETLSYWTPTAFLRYKLFNEIEDTSILYLDPDVVFSKKENNLYLEEFLQPKDGKISMWGYREINNGIMFAKNVEKKYLKALSTHGLTISPQSLKADKRYDLGSLIMFLNYMVKIKQNFFALIKDITINIYVTENNIHKEKYLPNMVYHFVGKKTDNIMEGMNLARE